MTALILTALLQQLPTDEQAESALKTFKAEYAKHGIEGRIAAIKELLKVPHEKTIHGLAEPLTADADPIRIAACKDLAEIDHPASVEVLVAAIPANENRHEVMTALSAALGTLGWQSAAPPLHELVRKIAEADIRQSLPQVVHALGQIGSPGSVEVLADLLLKLQGPRRNPWPNEGPILAAAEAALHAITGSSERKAQNWLDWWKSHQADLTAKAHRIYWSRKTHERTTVSAGDKTPEDSVLVATRLTDAPAAGEPKKKKKK